MKTAPTLLFCVFFAIFCLFLPSNGPYAQEDNSSKSLIKIIKPVHFGMPIDCRAGYDCWVMNYVDFGPDDDLKTDPACLARTYDGHKGTDFALLDGKTMARGVDVLAAADGTISRLRDGEEDRWHTKEQLDEIRENQKECGNGIFIDHGNNVSTIYCHLKKGSIAVKRGQEVKKGDKIAQVGQSGMTEFPHLHFGIIKDGKVLDPYTGKDSQSQCSIEGDPLWDEDVILDYKPLTIQAAGFLNKVPDFEAIEREATMVQEIAIDDGIMAFWVMLLGVREGDEVIIEVKDPNGNIFVERKMIQDRTRARQFYYTGKKLNNPSIAEGGYTGSIKVIRGDKSWYKTSAVLLNK